MDHENDNYDENNESNNIEDIMDALDEDYATEGEEDYDGSLSYGQFQQNSDQSVIDKLREIRKNAQNHMNNYGNRKHKKDEDIDERDGRKNKKDEKKEDGKKGDNIDDRNGSSNKKGKKNKDDAAGNGAKEVGKEGAKEAGKEGAKEAGKAAGKEAAKETTKEVAKEASKEAAKEAGKAASSKGLITALAAVGKYILIGLGILYLIYLIIIIPIILYESFVSSISSYFGLSEMTTSENYTLKDFEKDGLFTDYKYKYVKKTCDLDNYKESECLCSPDEKDCIGLNHEDLIKVLKSDDKCKIDSSWLQFWDKLSLGFTGGKFNDDCQLLRFVRGTIQARENYYKDYNLKLDKGLIVSTILSSYEYQKNDIYSSTSAQSDRIVDSVYHYEVLKDIAKEGIIKSQDVDKLIKSTILEEIYPYYVYDGSSCILQSKVNYKFSLDKWKIYMRYGGVGANSYLGINDNGFSTAGYLAIRSDVILDAEIESYLQNKVFEIVPDSLLNLTGSGYVYDNALNNAWNQSAEECRNEKFFKDRNMTAVKDLKPYLQSIQDVMSAEAETFTPLTVTYRKPFIGPLVLYNDSATINFDYRAGYIYNKFPIFKNTEYDIMLTPKEIEQTIQEIISRKTDINSVLFFENDESDLVMEDPYVANTTYYWPIGSDTTTEVSGKTMAADDPASINITSYYGMRNHPVDGVYKMHKGIDISGKEGVTNVIASRSGKVVEMNNNCTPGNKNCGYGYGNYIKIMHPDGMYTFYAHLHKDSMRVSVNDEVLQGQLIAKVGNTGNTTGPHLHFEVRTSSVTRVNPLNYVDPTNPRPTDANYIQFVQGSDNRETVCKTFLATGFSENAVAGLMANIEHESGFKLDALSDGGTSNGLFQWHKGRLDNLKEYCGTEYLTSIKCQLDFFMYEITLKPNAQGGIYNYLRENHSAYQMGYEFCMRFERPAGGATSANNRGKLAESKYVRYVNNGCKD